MVPCDTNIFLGKASLRTHIGRTPRQQVCPSSLSRCLSRLPRRSAPPLATRLDPRDAYCSHASRARTAPAERCALARRMSGCTPPPQPGTACIPACTAAAIAEPRDASAAAHSPPLSRASQPRRTALPYICLLATARSLASQSLPGSSPSAGDATDSACRRPRLDAHAAACCP